MSERKRPRGGRDAKVRIALDLCKMAQRCGDLEKQKRALETVCMLYGVDPTQLTNQGLTGEEGRTKKPRLEGDVLESLTPPATPAPEIPASTGSAHATHELDKSVQCIVANIDSILNG